MVNEDDYLRATVVAATARYENALASLRDWQEEFVEAAQALEEAQIKLWTHDVLNVAKFMGES